MRHWYGFLTIAVLAAGTAASALAGEPPSWAWGFDSYAPPPPANPNRGRGPATPPDPTLLKLPGSTLQFTHAQIYSSFDPADWFPTSHPKMPDVVAHGRQPNVRACALCHYPNGKGRSENAGVSGLPVSYFIQTLLDFKNDKRRTSDLRKTNTRVMSTIAKAMTDEEMKASAEYFGSMKWTPQATWTRVSVTDYVADYAGSIKLTPWIRVIETDTVPKTRSAGGQYFALPGDEKEPIAGRIVEVPVNEELTETFRDPRSGFIAYTPKGSLKHGEALAKAANCALCHGADLRGMGPVPGIAGRSPSYMARQMFDMQAGNRDGEWTPLMKPVVDRMSNNDMRDVVAYAASLLQ